MIFVVCLTLSLRSFSTSDFFLRSITCVVNCFLSVSRLLSKTIAFPLSSTQQKYSQNSLKLPSNPGFNISTIGQISEPLL